MNKVIMKMLLFLALGNYCGAQQESKPLTIGEEIRLFSHTLEEERTINVYLPQGYAEEDTVHYPVVYVLDGGINEDFLHIAGIVQFNSQPWVARCPHSIIVGIGGNNRRRDFTFPVEDIDFVEKEGFQKAAFQHFGGSGDFIRFIEQELQPYIGKMFRTNGHNTVIGESLAGLFATEILCSRPHLFDSYFIISPSLWWGERTLLQNADSLLSTNLKKKVNVYIGVPNKDEDVPMYQDAEAIFGVLDKNPNVNAFFDYLPDELHATVLHQAVYNALGKMCGGRGSK